MPTSPFPGMNPYLEDTEIWPGFHHSLASEIMAYLNRKVGPKYYADVEIRTASASLNISQEHVMFPDVGVFNPSSEMPMKESVAVAIPGAPLERAVITDPVKSRAVKIYVTKTHLLVTSIEILSPVNKRPGPGLQAYQEKRYELLNGAVHFVELDLLRRGVRPGGEVYEPPLDTDYVLVVNRQRHKGLRISEIWPLALNEPFPLLPVPLLAPDPDVPLDLNDILKTIEERAGYTWRIDYSQPIPPPALRPAMATWWQEQQATNS